MFNYNIRVVSNDGVLKKSFGLSTRSQFESKLKELEASGAKLVSKSDTEARFQK